MTDQTIASQDPEASAKSLREGARFAAPISSIGPNAAPELDANNTRVDRATVTPTPKAKPAKTKKLEVTDQVLSEAKEPAEPTELSEAVKAKLLELGHPIPGPKTAAEPARPPVVTPGPPADPGPPPAAVRLTSHYGYWLEEGEHEGAGRLLKYWSEGQVERDPQPIADLVARGAPIAPHKD